MSLSILVCTYTQAYMCTSTHTYLYVYMCTSYIHVYTQTGECMCIDTLNTHILVCMSYHTLNIYRYVCMHYICAHIRCTYVCREHINKLENQVQLHPLNCIMDLKKLIRYVCVLPTNPKKRGRQ